jgi:hypothetical protein
VHALREGWADLERRAPKVSRVNRRTDEPMWSGGLLLLIAVLLPTLEWTLRRRWGLS